MEAKKKKKRFRQRNQGFWTVCYIQIFPVLEITFPGHLKLKDRGNPDDYGSSILLDMKRKTGFSVNC